jgi:hypothetical protein
MLHAGLLYFLTSFTDPDYYWAYESCPESEKSTDISLFSPTLLRKKKKGQV